MDETDVQQQTQQQTEAPQGKEQRRYYTVQEVADLLRISRSLAYRAVRCGDIPCVRVGRIVRVPADWVAEPAGSWRREE